MYLTFIIHYPETISLTKKKTMLTFENLESALGHRCVPNIESDENFEPGNIYILSTVNKINNNPRAKEEHNDNDSFPDSDEETEGSQSTGVPGCAQQ
jgi:DnaJ family protein A protein 1/DnaJ family protein A protein 2